MRIATLVLGLVLGVFLFTQSALLYSIGGVFDNDEASTFGVAGLLAVLLWLIASSLVFAAPTVSLGVFLLAGGTCFLRGQGIGDLLIWGGASVGLAYLSYLSIEEKERVDADRALVRAAAQAFLAAQQSTQTSVESQAPKWFRPRPAATTRQDGAKTNFFEPHYRDRDDAAYGLTDAERAWQARIEGTE